jgi:hypothetical protein
VLILGVGVVLGAFASSISFAAWTSAQPPPRAPEPTPVVCAAASPTVCPECPECPEPTLVRDPPPLDESGNPQLPAPTGPALSARECERARQRPMQVSDGKLAECARQNLLGSCHLAPGGACREVVRVDQLCPEGTCAAPLDRSGCVSAPHYGPGSYFFNCSGDAEEVAGCVVRKLAKAGYCKR